ncbi:hypothetical protein FEM33_04415 [Dyadobacter flavalbus]|uniref:Uncharacterized protein n=1 Tax=Dyadobacter flavalbus TaxID=2579942 RepID=A0A5M8R2S1_9BACT|nr:hypothetical protein [Dyadobacter flavalbus]KAA6441053.1 hypothetical protein FEM33_04415 [Dyadobacter flavalbus]
MVKITKNLSLMATAACFSTVLFMSSCSKDELTPTPESAVNKDANLRVAVLPTGTQASDFKIVTGGIRHGSINALNTLEGSIDQIDPNYKKSISWGFLVSSRIDMNGPINKDPKRIIDPLVREYVVGAFDPSDPSSKPIKTGKIEILEPFAYREIYFRAFIVKEDGTTIYGNISHYLNETPIITPWELKANPVDANGMNISIIKQGSSPAVEYGIAYSYQKTAQDPINPVPTIADKIINAYKPSLGSYISYTPGNSFSAPIDFQYYQLYYRPYVKLQNGSIVYGNVAYSHKRPKIVLK